MNTSDAYNLWASNYDSSPNRTRDLEEQALQSVLGPYSFTKILELGCGTGKNTSWLVKKTNHITAVDFSEKMLQKARKRKGLEKVEFLVRDILGDWNFSSEKYDLVTCSLVLEHIEMLDEIFLKISSVLSENGICYVGELHPFKQYTGSKARFETAEGLQVVPCFNHHISDFVHAAAKAGLYLELLEEFFDEGDRNAIPRILCLVFRKG